MSTILTVENLSKCYGSKGNVTKAVDNISFDVDEGEFVGIMGPSGSGKTTLLNCISTIDSATSGHIYLGQSEKRKAGEAPTLPTVSRSGKKSAVDDITKLSSSKLAKFRREKLGFIFQDFNLLDTLTSYENIALALTMLKVPAKEIEGRVKEVASLLNISDVLDRFPYQMSGGQKQRVAAARAMVTNPSLVLADEPTGALDSKASRVLLESFGELNTQRNATILMVTHDAYAASFCKRILFLRDGKVFNELIRGDDTRKEFFDRIMEVVALLGGGLDAD